jgi:hypothetical protein
MLSSDHPFEGGERPLEGLHSSFQDLLKKNDGAPYFAPDTKKNTLNYRVQLEPPPFQLLNSEDKPLFVLHRDLAEEKPTLIVLRGENKKQEQVKVIIPSSESLTEHAKAIGIRHIGSLYAGLSGELEFVCHLVR